MSHRTSPAEPAHKEKKMKFCTFTPQALLLLALSTLPASAQSTAKWSKILPACRTSSGDLLRLHEPRTFSKIPLKPAVSGLAKTYQFTSADYPGSASVARVRREYNGGRRLHTGTGQRIGVYIKSEYVRTVHRAQFHQRNHGNQYRRPNRWNLCRFKRYDSRIP